MRIQGLRAVAVVTVTFCSVAFAGDPFLKMDGNGDGRLSPDEHARGAKAMFEAMDANKDGRVTADEMTAAHDKVAGKKAAKAGLSSAEKIKVIDLDGDGTLSSAEHAAGSVAMFTKIDSDGDGFVSKAEQAAGHAALMKK